MQIQPVITWGNIVQVGGMVFAAAFFASSIKADQRVADERMAHYERRISGNEDALREIARSNTQLTRAVERLSVQLENVHSHAE